MANIYKHRKRVRRNWYGKFKLRLWFAAVFAVILAALGVIIMIDASKGDKPDPDTSAVQSITIGDKLNTFQTDYFSFQDSGNWVFIKKESTSSKYIYTKFNGVQPQHQLIVYVNEEPIPLYLASSRVVPVRIVN